MKDFILGALCVVTPYLCLQLHRERRIRKSEFDRVDKKIQNRTGEIKLMLDQQSKGVSAEFRNIWGEVKKRQLKDDM